VVSLSFLFVLSIGLRDRTGYHLNYVTSLSLSTFKQTLKCVSSVNKEHQLTLLWNRCCDLALLYKSSALFTYCLSRVPNQ